MEGGLMEFFLDTADVDEIREIAAWGILDGVTTNPSLIKKSGRDFREVVREIAESAQDNFCRSNCNGYRRNACTSSSTQIRTSRKCHH